MRARYIKTPNSSALGLYSQNPQLPVFHRSCEITMLKPTSVKTLVTLLTVCFILMASSPNLRGADARYLMTRSDPMMSPMGPPYGKDPRFDRLYDIIARLLRNGGGDLEYQIKSQLDNEP